MTSDSDYVLRIEKLTAEYDGNRALTVDFLGLRNQELLGVVGANGAGKSTMVGAILNWSRGAPKISGRIYLDGEDITPLTTPERVRRGLLLIPENQLIFHNMSVAENLAHHASPSQANSRHLYSLNDVYDLFPNLARRRDNMGWQLSGGERQMLGIARALRMAPRALLLDEPSIGLAPKLVSAVLQTIRQLADNGLTVLLIEQNVQAAIEVVDRIALLERGRVLAEGTAEEMRGDARIAEAYLGGHAK